MEPRFSVFLKNTKTKRQKTRSTIALFPIHKNVRSVRIDPSGKVSMTAVKIGPFGGLGPPKTAKNG